jgi:hypothetical protein
VFVFYDLFFDSCGTLYTKYRKKNIIRRFFKMKRMLFTLLMMLVFGACSSSDPAVVNTDAGGDADADADSDADADTDTDMDTDSDSDGDSDSDSDADTDADTDTDIDGDSDTDTDTDTDADTDTDTDSDTDADTDADTDTDADNACEFTCVASTGGGMSCNGQVDPFGVCPDNEVCCDEDPEQCTETCIEGGIQMCLSQGAPAMGECGDKETCCEVGAVLPDCSTTDGKCVSMMDCRGPGTQLLEAGCTNEKQVCCEIDPTVQPTTCTEAGGACVKSKNECTGTVSDDECPLNNPVCCLSDTPPTPCPSDQCTSPKDCDFVIDDMTCPNSSSGKKQVCCRP